MNGPSSNIVLSLSSRHLVVMPHPGAGADVYFVDPGKGAYWATSRVAQ